MGTKKENRFQFVSMEEIENNNEINIVDSPKEVNVDFFNYGTSEKEVKTVTKKRIKFYFGYEARVLLSIVVSITLILFACFLMSKTLNHKVSMQYPYDEEATVKYEVCMKDNVCIEENKEYKLNEVRNLNLKYNYNLLFSKAVNYNLSYSVVATTKIFDKDNSGMVYYRNEDILVPQKTLNTSNNSISFDEDVEVFINKYLTIIENNKYRYISEYSALLDVSLYIYEDNEIRNVASVKLPLTNEDFTVDKYNVSNVDKFVELERNKWDGYNILIAVISTLLIVIALIIIYRATRLVLKTFNNKSAYEQLIDDILNKYDSIIVIARDGYESTEERKVIKLENFDELLAEKDKTNKPIIFSRINDVKSEFVLEGKDKLYKYVLKEADIDE